MPNNTNITHLPTDESLAAGLAQIADAIGSSGGSSSGGFRLLADSVTVSTDLSGITFTLDYEGTPPNVSTATIRAATPGYTQEGISYAVSFANGTATFAIQTSNDAYYESAVAAVVVLGDYAVPVNISRLPVNYHPEFVGAPAQAFEIVGSVDNTIDLSDYIYPNDYDMSGDIILCNIPNCYVSGCDLVIPDGTFTSSCTFIGWLKFENHNSAMAVTLEVTP
ncbi:MAG: hypothetical protein IJJ41_04175 [Clostridia bacterium]|nr:hypothetical protein [Clostridia bacterium]